MDVYNPQIYPGDIYAFQAISTKVAVTIEDDDDSYLQKIYSHLHKIYQ